MKAPAAAFAYCEDAVRAHDKDRFISDLFAPPPRRAFLFALHAFNLEIARVPELVREPLAGEVRLQWWRDVLMGAGRGEVAANPVAAALQDTIAQCALDGGPLVELIEARRFDLYREPMQTIAQFETYARQTSSALIGLALTILNGASPASQGAAEHAGLAIGTTALLRAVGPHAARGRVYLPLEVMTRHGAVPGDILSAAMTPEIGRVLAEMRERALAHVAAARPALADISPQAGPALLPLALVRAYLARMARRDFNPFREAADLPLWRRQWILWRAARDPARLTV